MDDDLKKNWWVIVSLALVVTIGISIATPIANKYKSQTNGINSMTWTAPQ